MKINKIFAIVQLSLMYISLICLFIASFIPGSEDPNPAITALVVTGIVTISLACMFALAICIISVVTIFKRGTLDCTKFVMVYKFIAMPWFIGNFVLCVLLVAGMLNPFLLIAIPLVVSILSSSTYICMIATSAMNVGYVISSWRNKTIRPCVILIVGMVLGFVFCVDFLGAIFVYSNNKKQLRIKVKEKTAQ